MFYVGQAVVPQSGTYLRSGSEQYSCAVVVSVEPLVLTSLAGDMRWESTVQAMELKSVCEAHPRYVHNGMRRLEPEQRSIFIDSAEAPRQIEFVLKFVLNEKAVAMLPSHLDLSTGNEYEIYYDATSDKVYGKRPWQSWATPFGEDYDREWTTQLEKELSYCHRFYLGNPELAHESA